MEAIIIINVTHDIESCTDTVCCKAQGIKHLILTGVCEFLVKMEKNDSNPAMFRTEFLKMLNEARKEEFEHDN